MVDPINEDELLLTIIKYLKESKQNELYQLLDELQPYDIARLYRDLPKKHHNKFLQLLAPQQIAILIQELDPKWQRGIIEKLKHKEITAMMDLMDRDDLADLLSSFSLEDIEKYLISMKQEESQSVKSLMEYAYDTAGGIMTDRYVWIKNFYTVREAVDKFKSFAKYADSIYYLYVLDEEKRLTGVVSYRDLLLANLDDMIEDIMYSRVISVSVDMDQEDVARTIERYDFIAVPVVDLENRLVGIITVDDIIDVVIKEANEDIEKLSASGRAIDFQTKAITAAFRRLPWLILLLFIGLISGNIISGYEDTIQQVVALSFFMPMIAGMTGNTGTQSLAVVVRGLLSNDVNKRIIYRLVFRELGVGLIIGAINGLLIFIIAYLWQDNIVLGFVVGASLFITLIIGTLAGTIIPLILYRLNIDPAIASGPLITTLNDIFSLTVYFGLARYFILHLT